MYICLYTYNSLHCMLECVWCTSTWKKRLKGNWPEAQMGYWGWLPRWFLFFVVFFPLVVLQIFSNNKKPFYHWKKKKRKEKWTEAAGEAAESSRPGFGENQIHKMCKVGTGPLFTPQAQSHQSEGRRSSRPRWAQRQAECDPVTRCFNVFKMSCQCLKIKKKRCWELERKITQNHRYLVTFF